MGLHRLDVGDCLSKYPKAVPTTTSINGLFSCGIYFYCTGNAKAIWSATIFNEDYNKTAEKYQQNIDQEAVYYQQATLVDNAIQALAPQRAGVTDMYYVGFAGYGYQKVFANEVKFAQQLFDKQFDTKNRSANLITHESTLNTIPLANTYNLTSILNGVAKNGRE